ncbi:unnamed protein product [Diabrotica balteata]|uniref:Uncharacterized protein n=1 Tax=Diabrotica balteata TaxID=107213 RepID=A0A9N9SQM3_DIABA|nr:unnamed protein product [Diabrotica balteata]
MNTKKEPVQESCQVENNNVTAESPNVLLQSKEDTTWLVNSTETEIINEVNRTTQTRKNKNRPRGKEKNERDKEKHPMRAVYEVKHKKTKEAWKNRVINSTPEIQELKDKVVEKENVERRKLANKVKRQIKQKIEPKGKATYNSGLERKSVDDTFPEKRALYRMAKEGIERNDEKGTGIRER